MFDVKLNFLRYLLGQIIIVRKKFLPGFAAFVYTIFVGFYYFLRFKNKIRDYMKTV